MALLVAACSGDVTESEEYLELQAELETQTEAVAEIQNQLEDSNSRESELTAELESMRSELEDLTAEVDEANTRADQAVTDLEDYINRPWPEPLKDEFVVGCSQQPDEGLTAEQQVELCSCLVDELEQQLTLDDFLALSASAFALGDDADVNPITGFPSDISDDLAEAIVNAATTCALSLERNDLLVVLTKRTWA